MLVRLTPQAKILLGMLLEPPVRMRTREEIRRRLWSTNTFVDYERGLNKVIHSLREALGETAGNHHFIETVAGEGYRFVPLLLEAASPAASRPGAARSAWLAVLPIATEPDPDLMLLGSRLTSRLTDELSAMQGVRVLANSTVKSRNLEGRCPRDAGESLGVRAVIAGELIRRETGLSLRLELIDVTDGALLRSARIERPSPPLACCEGELAQEILGQIQPIGNSAARLRKFPVPVLLMERKAAVV